MKRNYVEARLRVVRLDGRNVLLAGSSPVTGSAPGMMKSNYTMSGGVFE